MRYQPGIVDENDIAYAGARFTYEVYDMETDPAAPLAVCDTPKEAARIVSLLNDLSARLDTALAALALRDVGYRVHETHQLGGGFPDLVVCGVDRRHSGWPLSVQHSGGRRAVR